MTESIRLHELNVKAMASEEDPFGQRGFSEVSATFETTDPVLIERLWQAKEEKTSITLRCGILKVDGRIGKLTISGSKADTVLTIDDIKCEAEIPIRRGLHRPPT